MIFLYDSKKSIYNEKKNNPDYKINIVFVFPQFSAS